MKKIFESDDKKSYIMEIVAEKEEGDENAEILHVIEVQRPKYKKPFLGGFKNTKDN